MLYYDCPACKARCETTDAFAGKTVFCPHCGKQVTVPSDAISTSPPPRPRPAPPKRPDTGAIAAGAPPAQAPAASAPTPTEGSGAGMRNFILVLGGIGALVFLAVWFLPGNTGGGGGPSNVANPVVVMDTSMGAITIELFQDKSPISTDNFIRYVENKHYDGTVFHRVMKDFMIQGGGFTPGMKQRATFDQIRNEAGNGLKNERGTIAMARTGEPHSATSQFFINVVDNGQKLGPGGVDEFGYAVFGKVIDGMDVVDAIKMVPVRRSDGPEVSTPVKDVLIRSVRLVETKKADTPKDK